MVFKCAQILCLVVFYILYVSGREDSSIPKTISNGVCDLNRLESRLQRFESLIMERVNVLRNDLRESTRTIEYQNSDTRNAVEECRNDVRRLFSGRTRRYESDSVQHLQGGSNIEESMANLTKGIQLSIASSHVLNSNFKNYFSDVLNDTKAILEKLDRLLVDTTFQSASASASATIVHNQNPKNCKEIKEQNANAKSDIYLVQPDINSKPFMVFCEMEAEGGGWLTIHNRYQGSQEFYLEWKDYKMGFGNIAGEYWLGLENIYQLTGNQINELFVEVMDPTKNTAFAHYAYFSIGSEEEGYPLKVLGGYRGDAGDSLSYHAGSKFSTKDKDQDSWIEGNCAQSHSGAWWYKACDKSNLNGRYFPGEIPDPLWYQGMYWGDFKGPQIGLLRARMMIRPKSSASA